MEGRDSKGRFSQGNKGKPAGYHNKKLVGKLKTAIIHAVNQYVREEKESAAQLSIFIDGNKNGAISGVYIVEANGWFRIGASSDLHSRIKSHKDTNLADVVAFCTFPTKTISEANMLESVLHEKLSQYSVGNSWYELNDEQLLAIIRYANSICYGK